MECLTTQLYERDLERYEKFGKGVGREEARFVKRFKVFDGGKIGQGLDHLL
jgi:hypothetical protein